MLVRRVLAFSFLILFATPAFADVYIRTKVSSTGFGGLGGTKGTTETWVSGVKQAEASKMDFSSPLLRALTSDEKSRSVTDLERGVILHIDDKEKTYTEMSFEEMFARLREMQEKMKEGYAGAPSGGTQEVPVAKEGAEAKVDVAVDRTGESRKIAGMATERAVMKMLSTTVDAESGEEVTFKVVYDAWLTKEFSAQAEIDGFQRAYAEKIGAVFSPDDVNVSTAMVSAGTSMERLAAEMEKLQGYPVSATVRMGTVLTPEQRAELKAAMEADPPKEEKKGGGLGGLKGGIGGLGKKLTDKAVDSATDKVADAAAEKLAKSLFGDGVSTDSEGDPVLFSFTTEVEKVEFKTVDAKRFAVPEGYRKLER